MSHEKAKSYVYRNTVRPMFSSSKEFSGTMDIRPEFSKCDHGDCYSFVFGLPFYEENAQGGIENSGKNIFEIRIPNFCYIQVIVFDLSKQKRCFSQFFLLAHLLSPNRCHW